ncbi:hypothetical protein FRB98_005274 [Tulasnella sp. 332]|nr:hypothetical protein FRB98_005274 [Tulasnella sp. 332]
MDPLEASPKDMSQSFTVLSTQASMASIFTALTVKRAFGENDASNLDLASNFVAKIEYRKLGLIRVRILLSLPWVFLKWAIVFFCMGFTCFCFDLHHESCPIIIWVEAIYAFLLIVGSLPTWIQIYSEGPSGSPMSKGIDHLHSLQGKIIDLARKGRSRPIASQGNSTSNSSSIPSPSLNSTARSQGIGITQPIPADGTAVCRAT